MKHVLLTANQLGHLLQTARKAGALTQAELASRIGVSQSRLSQLELSPGSASVDQLLALCSSLGLELFLQKKADTRSGPLPSEW